MMDKFTENWHKVIISEAQDKLGRTLTKVELKFVMSREGYIALEGVEDVVRGLSGEKLESYLNSEHISE